MLSSQLYEDQSRKTPNRLDEGVRLIRTSPRLPPHHISSSSPLFSQDAVWASHPRFFSSIDVENDSHDIARTLDYLGLEAPSEPFTRQLPIQPPRYYSTPIHEVSSRPPAVMQSPSMPLALQHIHQTPSAQVAPAAMQSPSMPLALQYIHQTASAQLAPRHLVRLKAC
jgi:hypothetical protein